MLFFSAHFNPSVTRTALTLRKNDVFTRTHTSKRTFRNTAHMFQTPAELYRSVFLARQIQRDLRRFLSLEIDDDMRRIAQTAVDGVDAFFTGGPMFKGKDHLGEMQKIVRAFGELPTFARALLQSGHPEMTREEVMGLVSQCVTLYHNSIKMQEMYVGAFSTQFFTDYCMNLPS